MFVCYVLMVSILTFCIIVLCLYTSICLSMINREDVPILIGMGMGSILVGFVFFAIGLVRVRLICKIFILFGMYGVFSI